MPTAGDLGELRSAIIANLGGEGGLVVGSGYIARPGALADRQHWLEWWKAERDGRPARLVVDLDPASDGFLDYTCQPWFTVPMSTGERHITGPYVDYVCTDEYSLTFTVPVWHAGEAVGVVGSDVYVSGFELALLPRLRALGTPAALVNAQGRVIVSNTVRQVTGSLVRDPDVPLLWRAAAGWDGAGRDGAALHRCGDLPLALVQLGR